MGYRCVSIYHPMRSSLFPSALGLSLLVLFGAGCRGGGDRPTPPPPDPTAIFGSPDATTTAAIPPEGMSCNHEYYPLRPGYFIQYHTTYPAAAGASGEGYYAMRVMRVTSGSVYMKSIHARPGGGDPISSDVEYRCIGGGLYAAGYANTGSLAPGGPEQNRFEVRTDRAEGAFLPAHLDVGSHWSSSFDIKMTPLARTDVDGRPTRPIAMSVGIERAALGIEHVRVPAGEYEAMKISTKTSFDGSPSFTGTEWWVKGVGMVKSTYAAGITPEENIVTEATTVEVPR